MSNHSRATTTGRKPLARVEHLRAVLRSLSPIARVDADRELFFSLSLPLRNAADLDALLAELQEPTSRRFRRYLSADEFARAYGPTETDYARVVRFAEANDFDVVAKHANRAVLSLKASARRVEKAFGIELHVYRHPIEEDRTFFAPSSDPTVDAALPILDIHGLHDYFAGKPIANRVSPAGDAPQPEPGPRGGALTSDDLRRAYAPGFAGRGRGQAVGIYNPPHGLDVSDVLAYQKRVGISPPVPVTKVLIDGFDVPTDGFSGEVTTDVEMAIAMAPGLSQVLVYQSNDAMAVLNRMATDNIAKQLSTSWPTPLQGRGADQVYKQMAAQGQTFFSASGDAGSYYYLGKNRQPFYADDPYITVVAGTEVTLSETGDWQEEIVWHDSFGSGGGGTMGNYPLPDWQKGIDMSVNRGSTAYRNSPDVALTATGIYFYQGGDSVTGGTSAAAPLWAGYIALVNESAANAGKPSVGWLNPSLYTIGKASGANAYFHDIVQGNNFTPWNDNPDGANEYSAVPGYDCCTGWGTPTGRAIIEVLGRDGPPLEPVQSKSIVAIGDASGRLDLFSLTAGAAVAHVHQVVPNGNWSPWLSLAGHDLRQIRAGRNRDGRLEVFALGGDRSIYHRWESAPEGGWGSWASLQGIAIRAIEVANNQDGRLELFALGGDRAIYHRWQTAPNGGWGAWSTLQGHDLQDLAVGSNQDGRLELFALGGDGAVYHRWQATPNGNWRGWSTLQGHNLQGLAVGSNQDGRLELFALGGDRAIYHRWQARPNGAWGGWSTLQGHDLQDLVVGSNQDGRLELFALGGNGYVYHRWQLTKNGGWSNWGFLR